MMNRKRKATAVAWIAFSDLAEDFINQDYNEIESGTIYYASNQQLKEFLKLHNHWYEALKPSVEYIEQTRKKEKERGKKAEHVEI